MSNNLTLKTTITDKYQTVVPSDLRKRLNIKKGKTLVWRIIQEGPVPLVLVLPQPENWSQYLSGLGKRVWQDADVDEYLQKIKKEWLK